MCERRKTYFLFSKNLSPAYGLLIDQISVNMFLICTVLIVFLHTIHLIVSPIERPQPCDNYTTRDVSTYDRQLSVEHGRAIAGLTDAHTLHNLCVRDHVLRGDADGTIPFMQAGARKIRS